MNAGLRWRRVLGGALIAGCCAVPAAAQQTDAEEATTAQDAAVEAAERSTEEMMERIDAMLLADDEEVSGSVGYAYDPGTRRDPFISLASGRLPQADQGPRPEGLAGVLIDEISLSGIIATARGVVAQIRAANQDRGFLIRAGDELMDGVVVAVEDDRVVFRQEVRDPVALKPFREVVKTLNP